MSLILPSYKSGFARHAGEAAYPELWEGIGTSFCPSLGITGSTVRDPLTGNTGTTGSDDAWVCGQHGTAFEISSANTSFTMDKLVGSGQASFSTPHSSALSFWIYIETWGTGYTQHTLLSTDDGFSQGYKIASQNLNNVDQGRISVGGNQTVTAIDDLAVREWHSIVVTKRSNSNTAYLYVDGELLSSTTQSGPVNDGLYISPTNMATAPPTVLFDDMRIWYRGLTENQVKLLATRPGIAYERKRRVFYSIPAAAPAATTTGGAVLVKDSTKPSYKSGFYSPQRGGVPAYPELWEGCIHAWNPSLGNTGDVIQDQQASRTNLTLENHTLTSIWTNVDGVQCLDFDGTNDRLVSTADNPPIPFSEFTLSAWIYVDTLNNSFRTLFDLGKHVSAGDRQGDLSVYSATEAGTQNLSIAFNRNNASTFTYVTNLAHGGFSQAGNWGSLPKNRWMHLSITFNSETELRVFYDGDQVGNTVNQTTAYPPLQTSDSKWHLGYSPDVTTYGTTRHHDGKMTDVLIHNRALRPNEVRLLATRPGIAYERKRRVVYTSDTAAATKGVPVSPRSVFTRQSLNAVMGPQNVFTAKDPAPAVTKTYNVFRPVILRASR